MPTSLATRQETLRAALATALPNHQITFTASPPPAPLPALQIAFLGSTACHTIRWKLTLRMPAHLPPATAAALALESRAVLIAAFAGTRYRLSEDTLQEPLDHAAVSIFTTDAMTTGVTLPHPQEETFERSAPPSGRYLDGTPYRRLLSAPAVSLRWKFNHLSQADHEAIRALPDQVEFTLRATDATTHRALLIDNQHDQAIGVTNLKFTLRPVPEI